MTSSRPAYQLSLNNVSMSRGRSLLFTDLSFQLSAGHILWVQGDNGIGKSTLLKLCAGLLRPSEGDISWTRAQLPVTANKLVSYQGHEKALKPTLTVGEDLTFWAKIYGHNPKKAKEHTKALEIFQKWDAPISTLSQGQKQRTALARLLISNRDIWVMDEPWAALDSHSCDIINHMIKAHIQKKGAVILAAHQEPKGFGCPARHLRLQTTAQADL